MATPISKYVDVTVTVADRLIQQAGFGVPLIFGEFSAPSSWASGQRTKAYTSLTAVGDDFATTTKVYKAASAMLSGNRAPSTVKVGRADSGDADIAASLDAIKTYDPDWYGLVATHRSEADLNSIASWVSSAGTYIAGLCSEDAGVYDSSEDTDIASDLEAAEYNRTFYLWSHNGGVDVTGAGYVVADEVATITETDHGLREGDSVTFSNSSESAGSKIDGNRTVASVVDSDNFTVAATGVADVGSGDTATVDYFARYEFPEARWMGHMLPTTPGSETWAFKPLAGQIPTPLSLLTVAQQDAIKAKNANLYAEMGGLGITQNGTMASGRYIDVQRGTDWLGIRIAERVAQRLANSPKIPYTDAGIGMIRGDIASVLQDGVNNGLLGVLAGSEAGEYWVIDIPALADISSSDRAARNLPDVVVTVRLAGAIHNVTIGVNVAL